MSISEFFTNTLGANLSNTRWSWGAFNPDTNQLFLRVWEDQLETVAGIERISIFNTNIKRKSAGQPERKRHVEAMRNGAEGYGVLCTAKVTNSSGARSIKEFNQENLLKFGELHIEGDRVYAQVIARTPVRDLMRNRTGHSSLVPDLKSILTRKGDTTKEAIVDARVGQGMFRAQVLGLWNHRCCVTGSKTLDAIRASHIKPWRNANNNERLDPNNGLPLIATLDALFDSGLITFMQDGKLLVSNRLTSDEKKLLGLNRLRLIKRPNKQTAEFLTYHSECIFVDNLG